MVESRFEEMQRYVRIGPADAVLLRALLDHARAELPAIADAFYERIREHEGAHAVLTGEDQVERLKRSLVRWMERVLAGPRDEAYFEETAKIGRMHVRVGLPQHYMFTAMALIRVAFFRIIDKTMAASAADARDAVSRALDVELAIMLESYKDDLISRIQKKAALDSATTDRSRTRSYEHAVELARVLIVGIDSAGCIRLFNREAERVTGLGREEVIGRSFAEALLPEEMAQGYADVIARAARGEVGGADPWSSEVTTKAGKPRAVAWRFAYEKEDDDDVVLFAVGRDVTDENALAARLRQNEKLAAIGTLAAGLAHEIRNPLNGAQLHVTFLDRGLKRAGVTDSDTLGAVQVVGDEIRRLDALVNEFLEFARPKQLDKKPASLKELCERAVQLVASSATPGVKVHLDVPTTDIAIEVDAAKTEQMLLNLLQNAVEAVTPAGSGHVKLRARRQPHSVLLEIEDDGPGLVPPEAPIFDAFFSTKPHGTGLGLAIAHRIVTDHGGTIDVTSRPGKTVFAVTLPLHLG